MSTDDITSRVNKVVTRIGELRTEHAKAEARVEAAKADLARLGVKGLAHAKETLQAMEVELNRLTEEITTELDTIEKVLANY